MNTNTCPSHYRPTVKSYFSGAGGMDAGLQESGCEIIQSLEYDPHALDTLKANFRHTIVSKDIREVRVLSQESSDIVVGTYPCTKYSTIADIHGTRTGDDLFLHFFRHVAIEQPECYIVENVPGMLKFPIVTEAMTKLPGYYVNIFCPLNSSNWLPQDRKRLILIGTKRKFNISSPTPKCNRILLRDIVEKDVPVRDLPEYFHSRLNGKYRDRPIISDPGNKYELAPTCVAHYSKDISTRVVKDKSHPLGVRPWTVREYARLQGFPDWFVFKGGDAQSYKQIGNAVAFHVAHWIGDNMVKYFNEARTPSHAA